MPENGSESQKQRCGFDPPWDFPPVRRMFILFGLGVALILPLQNASDACILLCEQNVLLSFVVLAKTWSKFCEKLRKLEKVTLKWQFGVFIGFFHDTEVD